MLLSGPSLLYMKLYRNFFPSYYCTRTSNNYCTTTYFTHTCTSASTTRHRLTLFLFPIVSVCHARILTQKYDTRLCDIVRMHIDRRCGRKIFECLLFQYCSNVLVIASKFWWLSNRQMFIMLKIGLLCYSTIPHFSLYYAP